MSHVRAFLRRSGRRVGWQTIRRREPRLRVLLSRVTSNTISLMMRSWTARLFAALAGNDTNGFIRLCHICLVKVDSLVRRDVSASSASGFTQCRACSVVTGWYPIKRAQRGGKPRTPLPLFVSQCKPRRLCKCCSWKRNRCLSPIPALSRPSPSPSGYAYILIPIASFQPRRFAGYCLDPPAKFLRNSGEREAAPPPLLPRGS